MTTTTLVRVMARGDTAAHWTAANPVLLRDELGYEEDTRKLKFGDGSTAWNALPYFGATTYTDEQAQDAVGNILVDSATVDFTYDDAGNAITAIVKDASISLAKMANLAANSILGNNTGAASTPVALTPSQVKTLLAIVAADVSGLAAIATSGSASDLSAGTVPAARMPAHTGDVTSAGGAVALTIANNAVTYGKMQDVSATNRFLGRITAGAGDPEELSGTQATTLLDAFTSTLKGLAPASGGGTANFLRADGTWAAPPSGSTVTPAALTKADDTNVTLTLGGTPATALLQGVSITVGWSGTLSVARGGLGFGTTTQGDLIYADAANSLAKLAKNTTAQRVLTNGGASNNPIWAQVDLTAGVTGILPGANGGTGNGFTAFTGPAGSLKTFTLPNASGTIPLLGQAQTWGASQTFTGFSLFADSYDLFAASPGNYGLFRSGTDVTIKGTTVTLSTAFPTLSGTEARVSVTGYGVMTKTNTSGFYCDQAIDCWLGYKYRGTQVVGAPQTGWTAPTGTALRTGYDTGTATLAQVAQTLKALIDDLKLHGLIAA